MAFLYVYHIVDFTFTLLFGLLHFGSGRLESSFISMTITIGKYYLNSFICAISSPSHLMFERPHAESFEIMEKLSIDFELINKHFERTANMIPNFSQPLISTAFKKVKDPLERGNPLKICQNPLKVR